MISFLLLAHVEHVSHGRQVNLKGDEIAQLATEYNATEIAFFRAIVR